MNALGFVVKKAREAYLILNPNRTAVTDCVGSMNYLEVGIRDGAVTLNRADTGEVRLKIEKHEVKFWAGDVYEHGDGSLRISATDESVLLQVDGNTRI